MDNRINIIVVITMVILSVTGCSRKHSKNITGDNNVIGSGNTYFPLSNGNSWIYETINPGNSGLNAISTLTVTAEIFFGIETFYENLTHEYISGGSVSERDYIYMSNDTLYASQPSTPDWYVLYILKDDSSLVGNTFFADLTSSGDVVTHFMVDNDVDVNVPAGSFTNCLHYRRTIFSVITYVTDIYFAPNVGPIYFYVDQEVDCEMKLVDFNQ